MKDEKMKAEALIKINGLRQEALKDEGDCQKALKRIGVAKDIIADKQYWNGYQDALENATNKIRRIRIG